METEIRMIEILTRLENNIDLLINKITYDR